MYAHTECFKVIDKRGISKIPSARFVTLTLGFDATIQIRQWNTDRWVDAKSIMSIMLLALSYRSIVEIRVEGTSPAEVIAEITNMDDLFQIASEQDKNEFLELLQERINEKKRYKKQRKKVNAKEASSGIVICRSKLKSQVLSCFREALSDSIILNVYDSDEIYSEAHVLKLVERQADFIVLPLSLPNYSSLRIAECIHQNQLPTRLILVSITDCKEDKLMSLFDAFIPLNKLNYTLILAALQTELFRHSDQNYIDKFIAAVLSNASCFRTYGGRHQIGPKPSSNMEDYRENSESRADLTLGLCNRVEGELYAVASELKKLPKLTEIESAFIKDVADIKSFNMNSYTYGGPGDPMFAVRCAKLALKLNRAGRVSLDLPALTAVRKSPPVFISYAHNDAAFVDMLEKSLAHSGYTIWRDLKSAVAGPLEKQVQAAIEQSIVIVVLTSSSIKSDWVEWEVRKAREAQKTQGRYTLCPLSLDEAWKNGDWPSRLQEQIEEYLILDFSNWQSPEDYSAVLQRLLEGLQNWYQEEYM